MCTVHCAHITCAEVCALLTLLILLVLSVCTAHFADITCAEGTVFGNVPASYNRDCSLGSAKKQSPE